MKTKLQSYLKRLQAYRSTQNLARMQDEFAVETLRDKVNSGEGVHVQLAHAESNLLKRWACISGLDDEIEQVRLQIKNIEPAI